MTTRPDSTPSARPREKCTFVFVTSRNWPDKNKWTKNKQKLNGWKPEQMATVRQFLLQPFRAHLLQSFRAPSSRPAHQLPPLLGRPVPSATVSHVAKTLDAAIFHRRCLDNCYKALIPDSVVPSRRTGAGALPLIYPDIPVQRCWAHKIGNILNELRKPDREDAERHLHNIMNAPNIAAARRFADHWRDAYPKAAECLHGDPDDLPARFRYPRPTGAGRCGPRTPSNDASGTSGSGPGP